MEMEEPTGTELLCAHAARYPLLRPVDAVKLLYQREFGGAHLLLDPARARLRLLEEYAAVPPDDRVPLLEPLGQGHVRLNLAAMRPCGVDVEQVWDWFSRSSSASDGDFTHYLRLLDELRAVTRRGLLPFSSEALDVFLRDYEASGYPILSHSPEYRAAYHPSYRAGQGQALHWIR